MSNSHPCPYPGCDSPVPYVQLACRAHWFQLPLDLRYRISRAYKSQKWAEHRAALAEAFSFYKAAAAYD